VFDGALIGAGSQRVMFQHGSLHEVVDQEKDRADAADVAEGTSSSGAERRTRTFAQAGS